MKKQLSAYLLEVIKHETVLTISFVLALVSSCIVIPSKEYIEYIDTRTLAILFCLMVIMAGLQRINVFSIVGGALIKKAKTLRLLIFVLILLCFFFSMLITNDVALLTFVPFTIVVLHMAEKDDRLIVTIVLETISANLGSMLTPMGNPQNLYLYSLSGLKLHSFILLMLPYGVVSLLAIGLLCFVLTPKGEVELCLSDNYSIIGKQTGKLVGYTLLFAVSLFVVARALDYRIGFLLVLISVIIIDRKVLLSVDYALLFTFIFLFVFIGNIKHIELVRNILAGLVQNHEIPASILSSQVISNVPAAILLSGFTSNTESLIVGTNIGGLGTMIASMASLISFKQYCHSSNPDKKRYLIVFTMLNILLLVVLVIAVLLMG